MSNYKSMLTRLKFTTILLSLVSGVLVAGVHAETNIDFFFKDSGQYDDVIVQEVISADTFVIESHLKKGERIRLIGLEAPDVPKSKKEKQMRDEYGFIIKERPSPLTTLEEEAYDFAKDLLQGKRLRLELDNQKNTRDHETYAYAFLADEDIFVNEEILRHGYADLQIRPPNTKYAERLRKAYREARKELKGLHAR